MKEMKKSFFLFLTVGILCLMTASCGSNKNALTLSSIEGEWNIIEVNGDSVKSDSEPFIGFNISDKAIYGNSGCNNFRGTLEVDSLKPGVMAFGTIGSTRMMCQDMTLEQAILTALSQVVAYSTVSDTPEKIALDNKDGKQIIILEKREVKPLSLSDLSGEWAIKAINGNEVLGTLDVPPFLGFDIDENRIYGNVGCNTVNGLLEQNSSVNNSLTFKNLASTQMLCPDMETERIVLECLNATKSFAKSADGNIVLLDGNGAELLVLAKQ